MTDSSDVREMSELTLTVDPEPASFRVALLGMLVVGFGLGYFLSYLIFQLNACNLIGVFAGFLVGALFVQMTERFLKPYFKSNRFLRLTFDTFELNEDDKSLIAINPMDEFSVHRWRFAIPRRTRVPKGWYVVALALEQDDLMLPVYTLLSPEDFEEMLTSDRFTKLKSKKELDADGGNLRLAGQQRRLLNAETARNIHGAEMSPENFQTMLQWLNVHYAERLA